MKVHVTVTDSSEHPISGARVVLAIAAKELAVLYSNSEGKAEHGEQTQYAGKTLACRVEKEGFQRQEMTHAVEGEDVRFQVKLVPMTKQAEKPGEGDLELKLSLKDEKGETVKGVTVTIEVAGGIAGTGASDKNGTVKIRLPGIRRSP